MLVMRGPRESARRRHLPCSPGSMAPSRYCCQPGATRPDSYATTTRCTRSRAWSFAMMRDTCVFAVSGREHEPLGDLVVRQPLADELQHLALPVGERGQALGVGCVAEADRHPLEQALGDPRREQRLAARHDPHGADEVDGLGVLHEEAARAGADGPGDVLVELERRHDHHVHALERRIGRDLLGRPEPVAARHADVHEHDVDRVPPHEREQFLAARRLADDLDVVLRLAAARGNRHARATGRRPAPPGSAASLPAREAAGGHARAAARARRRTPRIRRGAPPARACRGCRCPLVSPRTPAPSSSTVTRSRRRAARRRPPPSSRPRAARRW